MNSKHPATIIQFLEEVAWGELDYLVIDTPPGTSDEHISVCEFLNNSNPDGAIIVTTPQGVALSDVRKEISFCKKIEMPILGLVENMSGFMCPNCSSCYNIFSTGGGKALADRSEIPFIGRIPIDPKLGACLEVGQGFSLQYPTSPTLSSLQLWAQNTIAVHFPDDNSNSDSQ
jgi:Mrp family chromosome partitioning ATPase